MRSSDADQTRSDSQHGRREPGDQSRPFEARRWWLSALARWAVAGKIGTPGEAEAFALVVAAREAALRESALEERLARGEGLGRADAPYAPPIDDPTARMHG